jgi:hypothetical protein
MNTAAFRALVGVTTSLLAVPAGADLIEVSQVGFPGIPTAVVTPAQAAGGAPANGQVFRFVASTDADVIGIYDVRITGLLGTPLTTLYQHSFGDPGNANPPLPPLVAVFPALGADTWIDTPGVTSRLGADLPGDGASVFFDLENNGPQTNFEFAQLTIPPGEGFTFSGRVEIASTLTPGGTYSLPFSFSNIIPEPATGRLAAAALAGAVLIGRWPRGKSVQSLTAAPRR